MRTDIIRVYKDVHSWVGIISGLALFIAFYAGALTMFEGPLQRWASPPPTLTAPLPLDATPELVARVLAEHPEAAGGYDIHLSTGPERPARLSWTVGDHDHGAGKTFHAGLNADGSLQVLSQGPSPVAQFIDTLHQQVGLPLDHEIAMPIMGAIALLYAIALVSGVIVLIPSLVKDLFALRLGKNLKRMWLDVHNVLGLFSLPFHIIMALTAVVFAFHDQFYLAQDSVTGAPPAISRDNDPNPDGEQRSQPLLPPPALVARLAEQAPGFTPTTLSYSHEAATVRLRVLGKDDRYGLRGPDFGLASVDPYTGSILSSDYLPGHQTPAFATVTSFFALHFGNYGGAPIRWSYFLLGMAGAALFYTGNLLWIESRRKRERRAGDVEQTRPTRLLAALTVGISLGCVAGISVTLAAAKVLPQLTDSVGLWHQIIYYAVFLAMTAWALARGGAKAGYELLYASAVTCLFIPAASLLTIIGIGWNHRGNGFTVEIVAVTGALLLFHLARRARLRALSAPRDSVWHESRSAHSHAPAIANSEAA